MNSDDRKQTKQSMINPKEVVQGLAIVLLGAVAFSLTLKFFEPCASLGISFTGFVLLIVAIIFGRAGRLNIAGVSGTGFLLFLFLSFLNCPPLALFSL